MAALGNATVNNAVIAGTTLLQNVLSIPVGIFNTLDDQRFSSYWNNPLSQKLADWQQKAQEALPIYKGSEYEDMSLWRQLGKGVFWAELWQNMGFTEGAMAAALITKGIGAPSILSSFMGTLGEATVQAVNKYNENVKRKRDLLD